MPKLFLLRHLQSQWNKENKFTGWTDVPLSEEGLKSVKEVAEKLKEEKIDAVYTSPLKRNKETVSLVLENLNKSNLPIVADKALDERNYGSLQGMDKNDAASKYGKNRVHLWRRSWDEAPLEGESLKDVYERTTPFYRKHIEKDLKEGKNVLVVASHNSLRALIKYVEKISDQNIIDVEMAYGELRVYEFDDSFKVKSKKII